jgi:hypothetical protein
MVISSTFGPKDVYRPVRNRNSWRKRQPLRQWVIDCDKSLVNTVSMKAVARERKGLLGNGWLLSGLVQVVDFVHRLIIGGFGKNLFLIIRI